MIKYGKLIIGLVMLVSLALVLSYCGSSSSDSSTTSTGTASAGAGASASISAIRGATLSLSATAATSGAPSLGKATNLSEAVNGFYSGLRAKRAEASALKAKSAATVYKAPQPLNCTNGSGTKDIIGNTTTITYNYCTQNYYEPGIGNVSEAQNGTIVFVDNGTSFTISIGNSTTPYTDTITLLSTSTVLQNDVMTMTLVGALGSSMIPCGTSQSTDYSQLTLDMNGNFQSKGFDDAGVAYDESAVFTAFKLAVTNSALDNTCAATGGTIDESGMISYTDNLDSLGTESMDISVLNPLSLAWSSGTTGDTYTISGTVKMATSCFTGSLTLATTTPLSYPTNGDCPTSGEVVVSGDVNGTVVYTSTGGVQIKDSTGAVVETYTSCNEAQACL